MKWWQSINREKQIQNLPIAWYKTGVMKPALNNRLTILLLAAQNAFFLSEPNPLPKNWLAGSSLIFTKTWQTFSLVMFIATFCSANTFTSEDSETFQIWRNVLPHKRYTLLMIFLYFFSPHFLITILFLDFIFINYKCLTWNHKTEKNRKSLLIISLITNGRIKSDTKIQNNDIPETAWRSRAANNQRSSITKLQSEKILRGNNLPSCLCKHLPSSLKHEFILKPDTYYQERLQKESPTHPCYNIEKCNRIASWLLIWPM